MFFESERLTMRLEQFQVVVLYFAGVEEIGQAFADEVFRLFSNAHPMTQLQFPSTDLFSYLSFNT